MSAPVIQGWCPGALRPMMSGDGLVVRVRPRNNSYDLVVIFIAYAAAQGVIGALLTRLFPGTI